MVRVYRGLDVQSDFGGLFPWKSHAVEVGDGVRQAYVDEGPKNAPITFLFLHGNPTWGFLYRRFIQHFAPRFRTLAVDHVGFGRSDKPRDPAYYTLERHIQNLEKTLGTAKVEHVVPVVQDWGGPIGIGWATRHPAKVAGVVVLNTWAFVTENGGVRLPWVFKFLVLGKGGWKRATQKNIFTELFVARGGARKLTAQELTAYRAPHPTPEDRVGIGRFPQLIPETGATNHESYTTMLGIEQGLASIADKPALIVWAMKDPGFRKWALDRWRTVFKNLDGPHLLPQAKHYLQEDAPEDILARMDEWIGHRLLGAPARSAGRGAKAKAR